MKMRIYKQICGMAAVGSDKYYVFSAESPELKNTCAGLTFQGTFAVAKDAGKVKELYLGKGIEFGNDKMKIASANGDEISASLRIDGKKAVVYSTGVCKGFYNGKSHHIEERKLTKLSRGE